MRVYDFGSFPCRLPKPTRSYQALIKTPLGFLQSRLEILLVRACGIQQPTSRIKITRGLCTTYNFRLRPLPWPRDRQRHWAGNGGDWKQNWTKTHANIQWWTITTWLEQLCYVDLHDVHILFFGTKMSGKMIEAIEVIKRMRFTDVSNEKSQMPETDIVAFETTCWCDSQDLEYWFSRSLDELDLLSLGSSQLGCFGPSFL